MHPSGREGQDSKGQREENFALVRQWPLASQIGFGASRTWSYERHEMGRIKTKRMEPVAYYPYRDAKNCQAGKPGLHTKLGPYASMKQAEAKREEDETCGRPGFEYHDRIAVEPIIIPK
jgi:hypothetical protein